MNILAFAGSTRIKSYNKIVIQHAVEYIKSIGFNYNIEQVKQVDLAEYPLPLYDGDLEEMHGIPEPAITLREMLKQNQVFIISSPEYNSSISGVLKNMIDWCSRPYNNEENLLCFKEKMVILLSASVGNLGGIRGLAHVGNILHNLGCVILPYQLAIPNVHEEVSDQQQLPDKIKKKLQTIIKNNLDFIKKIPQG